MCGGYKGTEIDHVQHHKDLIGTALRYMVEDLQSLEKLDPAAAKQSRDRIAVVLGLPTPSDSLNVRESLAEIPPTGADQFVEGLEAGARAVASEPLAAVTGL